MNETQKILMLKVPSDEDGDIKYPADYIHSAVEMINRELPEGYKCLATLDFDYYMLDKDGKQLIEQIPECNFDKIVEFINGEGK